MPANHSDVEKRLWGAADELPANSKLKSSEYSVPARALIFLRYAEHKFTQARAKLANQAPALRVHHLVRPHR
jgi:type I restriction enzyme M protein